MKQKTAVKRRAKSTHLPRRGLYALAAQWRKKEPLPSWAKHERLRGSTLLEYSHRRTARRECANELERAIAKLPVDRQHLEAMVGFEQRSADTIQRLEEFAGELKIRLDTFLSTINTVMVVFRKIEQSERTARDKERRPA